MNEPLNSILNLGKAIKQDARSQKFRVTWDIYVANGGSGATLLYDRQVKTVKRFEWDQSVFGFSTAQMLFTNVSDEAILKVVNDIETTPDASQALYECIGYEGFQRLTLYGCKMQFQPAVNKRANKGH